MEVEEMFDKIKKVVPHEFGGSGTTLYIDPCKDLVLLIINIR